MEWWRNALACSIRGMTSPLHEDRMNAARIPQSSRADPVPPFVRVAGDGPAVLCLHSTGSSSRQWTRLTERLSKRFRVISADLISHGRSRSWARGEAPTLDAELDALSTVLESEAGAVHVVGHSYGGAVAIRLALRHPGRVATVSVFEPVMFRQLLE